ncbi:UDP-N-acetylmuramoylalanine--D-glutamate ligase [subsurface metagenome]
MIPEGGLRGLRAAIVGAGREGLALTRYLVHSGAAVTLSDIKPADALRDCLSLLQGLDVGLCLGGNPPDLLVADVLFVSPGVPPSAPIVVQARERGVPISSEPRLFTQICAAPVVGITGSSGKSTTAALTGEMYAASGKRVWVGGNIGLPLTARLLEAELPEVAVMELSSFQLELFSPGYQGASLEKRRSQASTEGWSPHEAAITNITPNHLDRHPSMAEYVRAKSQIIAFQRSDDWAVLSLDDDVTSGMTPRTVARVLHFSLERSVGDGAWLRGDHLVACLDGHERTFCHLPEVKLRGRHNLANILAAACCAMAGGVDLEAIRSAAISFPGMQHRLETVRRWRGIAFVNDSIATSPERAIAAIRSYQEPLVVLAGGRDKHLPWGEWADLVLERVRVLVAFGEARPIIENALADARGRRPEPGRGQTVVLAVDSLERAVAEAAKLARAGDVVLLAPGGTSFDAFEDFEARGERFRALVEGLP